MLFCGILFLWSGLSPSPLFMMDVTKGAVEGKKTISLKTCNFQANIPGKFHGSTMVKRNNATWHEALQEKKKKNRETVEPLSKLTAIKKKGLPFPWASLTFFPQFIHTFLDSGAGHCYEGAGKGNGELSIFCS